MRVETITALADLPTLPGVLVAPVAVAAGYPSPAQDYYSEPVDLNAHLIGDKTSTFILRVAGDSMTGAGIFDRDEIIVDRARSPQHGDVVVAVLDGELTVKRLDLTRGVLLQSENPAYPSIRLREHSDLVIWGVVTYAIRHVAV